MRLVLIQAKQQAGRQATAEWTAGMLQRKLAQSETLVRDLEARLAGAVMEAAGAHHHSPPY